MILFVLAALQGVELTGTVRDSASGFPIPAAVVQVLDSAGRPAARAIADQLGRYRIAAGTGAARVQFLRLGYRPRSIAFPASGALDVRLTRLATMLEAVTARAPAKCDRRRDSQVAFALWQQARAGLTGAAIAAQELPGDLSTATFERYYPEPNEPAAGQRVRLKSAHVGVAFGASHDVAAFVRGGFADGERHDMLFYAPDADVLLSDEFQAAYCFSLADRDRRHPERVGLRFAPAERQDGRIDVEGTLWIDTLARSLNRIEYEYLGLEPSAERYKPGGQAEFEKMPNGQELLGRWSIRAVGFRREAPSPLRERQGLNAPTPRREYFVTESGGELTRARWDDSTEWRARLGSLRLQLIDKRGRPIANRRLTLESTDYAATTDSAGAIQIADMVPGPYRLHVQDPYLKAVGASVLDTLFFALERGASLDTALVVGTIADYGLGACDPALKTLDAWLLIARITRDAVPTDSTQWELGGVRGVTDADGVLAACVRGESAPGELTLTVWDGANPKNEKAPSTTRVRIPRRVTVLPLDMGPAPRR